MIIIGCLLVLAALVATGFAIIGGQQSTVLEAGGVELSGSTAVIFGSGMATAMVLIGGVLLLGLGWTRRHRSLKELSALRREHTRQTAEPARSDSLPGQRRKAEQPADSASDTEP